MEPQSPDQGSHLNHWGGNIKSKIPDCQITPNPRRYWLLRTLTWLSNCTDWTWHLYTKPSCWQHPLQDTLPKQARQKHKNNHQQMGVPQTPKYTTSHSPAHQTKKKKKKKKPHLFLLECRHSSPLNKKSAQTNEPTFPSKGKKPKGRRNTTLKPGKRRPQTE